MRTTPFMATLLVLALHSSWHACNRLGKMTSGLDGVSHVATDGNHPLEITTRGVILSPVDTRSYALTSGTSRR